MAIQRGKLFMGAVFIALGVVFFVATTGRQPSLFADPNEMDVMTYPRFLIYGWLISSVLYLFKPVENVDWWGLQNCWPSLLKVVGAIALYIGMFSWMGLSISTFLFLLLFFFILDYRNWKKAIPIAALGAFLTWLVFVQILAITMPRPAWMAFVY